MIKKYNIDLDLYYWSDEIVYESNSRYISFYGESKKLKKLYKLRYSTRVSYNLEKFYLSNKNLWYNQKTNSIKTKKTKNVELPITKATHLKIQSKLT